MNTFLRVGILLLDFSAACSVDDNVEIACGLEGASVKFTGTCGFETESNIVTFGSGCTFESSQLINYQIDLYKLDR